MQAPNGDQATILVIDDDPVQRRLCEATLARAGFAVRLADSGEAGLAALKAAPVSLIVLDMMMPGLDGPAVLEAVMAGANPPPVVVQTAQGSIDAAVRMVRGGAFDFLVKPASPERLVAAVNGALRMARNEEPARRARTLAAERFSLDDLVSRSPYMDKVVRLAARAAASNIPVLIEGESGVGKEMVARAIQSQSDRRAKPFVTVNCGAIPANLVESTLFGHEKGAFTGAGERHDGKFVEADGGTLFLDEIGELPMEAQVKLLRAIQFSEIDPVGGKRPRNVDIRLISATNKNLLDEIRAGRFREDLFYRLNVFPIFVPPLRERRDDVEALAEHFIRRYSGLARQPGQRPGPRRLHPESLAMLKRHDWPGNIRELENAIYRALVLSDAQVLVPEDFGSVLPLVTAGGMQSMAAPNGTIRLDGAMRGDAEQSRAVSPDAGPVGPLRLFGPDGHVRRLEEIEADMISLAIAHYDGQLSEVARRLGIGRSTLYRKLGEFGISVAPGAANAPVPSNTSGLANGVCTDN